MRRHAHVQGIVRHRRELHAQIPRQTARAPGQAAQAEPIGELRRDAPGRDEAILQSRMLVEDRLQQRDFIAQRLDLGTQPTRGFVVDVARDTTGHDRIHQVTMSERGAVQAQHILFEAGELREAEGETRIVAEKAEIAQMIGNALALQ
jgi:hypothetical protein